MRALLTVVCTMFFSGAFAQSWVQDTTFDSSPDYRDVFFLNANMGWIVGSDGVIYHTANGGTTWAKQNSGVTDYLYSVFFLNQNLGWIAAGDKVLGTTNGGATWQTLYTDTLVQQFTMTEIGFIDADSGWVAGEIYPSGKGILLRSTDGGNEWWGEFGGNFTPTLTWFPADVDGVHDMKVVGGDSIFIAGGGGIGENINSRFSGWDDRWHSQSTGVVCPLRAIDMVSGLSGWTTGKLTFYTSAGSNFYWTRVNDPLGDEYWGKALHFSHLDTGWITSSSRIVYTDDRGATWTRQLETFETELEDIEFASKYVGFAVGTDGGVFRYDSTSIASSIVGPADVRPLTVYPNPATNAVLIYAPNADRIMVYNTQGALVYEEVVAENTDTNMQIDISTFSAGLYMIRASVAGQLFYSGKFLKE